MPSHQWLTVREAGIWLEEDRAKRDYFLAKSFPDNLWGQLNAHRMVEAIQSVFGPDGAYLHQEVDGMDIVRHVIFYPEDVVCEQVRLLLGNLRQAGWIEPNDFDVEMVPLINTFWQSMPTADRIDLAEFNDVSLDAILADQCPAELMLTVQEQADP